MQWLLNSAVEVPEGCEKLSEYWKLSQRKNVFSIGTYVTPVETALKLNIGSFTPGMLCYVLDCKTPDVTLQLGYDKSMLIAVQNKTRSVVVTGYVDPRVFVETTEPEKQIVSSSEGSNNLLINFANDYVNTTVRPGSFVRFRSHYEPHLELVKLNMGTSYDIINRLLILNVNEDSTVDVILELENGKTPCLNVHKAVLTEL